VTAGGHAEFDGDEQLGMTARTTAKSGVADARLAAGKVERFRWSRPRWGPEVLGRLVGFDGVGLFDEIEVADGGEQACGVAMADAVEVCGGVEIVGDGGQPATRTSAELGVRRSGRVGGA